VAAALLVIMVAAAVRGGFMAHGYLLPNSDQAMVGLMARHILAGERPLFYWGQSYNGTLESYLTALVYKLGGVDYMALHVAPIAFSLLFVAAIMALAHRLYGTCLALLSGVWLAAGPAELIGYSIDPGYNYLEAMACGTLALVFLLGLTQNTWWRLPAATFVVGVGIWAQPLVAVYLPSLLIVTIDAVWRARQRVPVSVVIASLIAGGIALWPTLAYNLQTQWATLHFLLGRPYSTHLGLLESIRRLVVWAFPILLGPIPPSENPEVFQHYLHTHILLYSVTMAALALGLLLALVQLPDVLRGWAAEPGPRRAGEIALLLLAAVLIVTFLLSNWSSSSWSATDPRYLLPLYTLTPLALRLLFPSAVRANRRGITTQAGVQAAIISLILDGRQAMARLPTNRYTRRLARRGMPPQRRHIPSAVVLVLLLASGLAATATAAPQLPDYHPLALLLEQRGDQAVYGDYWLVYRLTLDSDQRLLPVVVQPNLKPGLNRYPPYLAAGLHASHYAWVVPYAGNVDATLRTCLGRLGVRYHHTVFDGMAIYDGIPVHGACYAAPATHR
jgi:hypothetical protein